MKILVFSDLHGDIPIYKKISQNYFSKVDQIWCLGDIFYNYRQGIESQEIADKLIEIMNNDTLPKSLFVLGNCENFLDCSKFKYTMNGNTSVIKEIDGLKILLNHGTNLKTLSERLHILKTNNCPILLYGHSHKYELSFVQGCYLFNPGSPSYPGNKYRIPTVMLIDTKAHKFELVDIISENAIETITLK